MMFTMFRGKRGGRARNTDDLDPRSMDLQRQYAPGSKISYDPELIVRFKAHHSSLVKLFSEIRPTVEHNQFDKARRSLQAFHRVLTTHLLEENIRLYTYLAKCLDQDEVNFELMVGLKKEMSEIGAKVMRFINHYEEFGINQESRDTFLAQYDQIGAVLTERIEREENSLYPLYLPPNQLGA